MRPMPMSRRAAPDLPEIVALAAALEQDEGRATQELAEREAHLAARLPAGGEEDPVGFAHAWLEARISSDRELEAVHQRAVTALQTTNVLLVVVAVLIGWGATLGAFYFDGSGRVNAVTVLALLVLVPALLLLPFLVALVPAAVAERVPGFRLVLGVGQALSPSRLAPLLWRIFPSSVRQTLELLSGRASAHQRQFAALQKWALLRWSQLFALSFQCTALVATLLLVVFTDLAFGWSTTLTTGDAQQDARRVHRITSVLAAPWSWAVPEAAPSLQLIEESRYFRVAAAPLSPAEAARLGGWWRFLVLAIAVYGLGPRVITYLVASSRLRASARAVVQLHPGLAAARRRLHRARLASVASQPEADSGPGFTSLAEASAPAAAASLAALVRWAGAPVPARLETLFSSVPRWEAGGAALVADDAASIDGVAHAARSTGGAEVLIIVKGWEPPLMEFLDFVKALRLALPGQGEAVLVLPVGVPDENEVPAATATQVALWRGRLQTLGDPWLRVVATAEEVEI